ncbi:MAG: hypothetical protein KDD66_03875 [Bdellovibrionales bacterium]|nr:hypothetical protein [Bdellovibrionales bacterium]
MRKIYLFALSFLATCLVANTALAQSGRVVDLGANSFVSSVWYDSSNDLAWVGGSNLSGLDTATMWSVDEVDAVTPNSLSPLEQGGYGIVNSISRDGSNVAGASKSPITTTQEGTIWAFGQWNSPQGTGFLSGGSSNSEVRGIATTGRTAGLSSGGWAFMKDMLGTITALPGLPGGTGLGTADNISADGDVCVGNSQNFIGLAVAAQWTSGCAVAEALEDPTSLFSSAVGISPDGSMVGGIATDSQGGWASAWVNGSLQFINDDQGQKFFGIVNAVTDDGLFVGGGIFNSSQKAFVWHTSWANAMTLEAWLQQNNVSNPPSLSSVNDVYHDGSTYHFAVEGDTSSYYVQTDDIDGGSQNPFDLSATPNPVQPGKWVTFTLSGGEPGYPALLVLKKFYGIQLPFPVIVGVGNFNSSGELSFNRRMLPFLQGTNTYQGVTLNQSYTELVFTPDMDLVIHY